MILGPVGLTVGQAPSLSRPGHSILLTLSFLLLTFWLYRGNALGADAHPVLDEVGVRMGMQVQKKRQYFHQYDIFASFRLPWEWRTDSGWGLVPKANGSLGVLHEQDKTGLIGSVGMALVFNKTGFGLEPELGINANVLDRRRYGDTNFGSILQFGAYMGASYRFDAGPVLSYRLQHISNAHVFYNPDTPNPGLDMHLIGISWHF